MARQKGDGRGRLGGRKAGTPNKNSAEKKELFRAFIEGRWDDFIKTYESIDDPVRKCSIFIDILPFAYPRLASVEYKDKSQAKTLQDELEASSGTGRSQLTA